MSAGGMGGARYNSILPTLRGTPISDTIDLAIALRQMITQVVMQAEEENRPAIWILASLKEALALTGELSHVSSNKNRVEGSGPSNSEGSQGQVHEHDSGRDPGTVSQGS